MSGKQQLNEFHNQENILDENTYCIFYNEIFRNLNSEFSLCDDVLKIVRDYHIIGNQISMEKLQEFAFLSIKDKDGKFFVSPEHLQFLVKQEINQSSNDFNDQEYDNFWRELLVMKNRDVQIKFEKLFSKHDSKQIYKLLTMKSKTPAALDKWIRDCIRNKNLNFSILNASISFVKTLLNKVPVNYLIKLTETLSNNRISTEQEFINHIKKVIAHDAENQNRINAKTTKIYEEIQTSIPFGDNNEPCFFSKKSIFSNN